MREEVKELQKKWEDMEAAAKHEETLNRLQGFVYCACYGLTNPSFHQLIESLFGQN